HPTIAAAARFLDRQPVHVPTDATRRRALPAPPARRRYGRAGVGLILVRLPRPVAGSGDLHAMTRAMHDWRSMLCPGGWVLAALTASGTDNGKAGHRATVIAAARTAGLSWQQEFLAPLAPLPEYEPRAMPDTAATTPAALLDGRHQVVHIKLLALRRPSGGDHA
ncbi:MAG: hypothetical protein ACRDSE_16280, partial [Pseudonocardiaceae bacterium]